MGTDTTAEMVLFHSAFVALKARCPLTIKPHPDDYKLAGEKKLFQGYVVGRCFLEHMNADIRFS